MPRTLKNAVEQRLSRILKMLVKAEGRKNRLDVRPYRGRVVRALERAIEKWDPKSSTTAGKSFDDWRRGVHAPDARRSWALGEALKSSGIAWCSGLWMLWTCGHYIDVVGTLATALAVPRSKQLRDDVYDLWLGLSAASALSGSTVLDHNDNVAIGFAMNRGSDFDSSQSLARYVFEVHEVARSRRDAFLDGIQSVLRRETAKIDLMYLHRHRRVFEKAFRRWVEPTLTVTRLKLLADNVPGRLAIAAMAVAGCQDTQIEVLETSLLCLADLWMRSYVVENPERMLSDEVRFIKDWRYSDFR